MRKRIFGFMFLFTLISYLLADTTIPAGSVSGTWDLAGSPYLIEGEITIPVGETLNIEPGVIVEFQGHYKFLINGYLQANGTENQQVTFTASNTFIGWHGLRFIGAPDYSNLSYCIIEFGKASGTDNDANGGGVFCLNSNPVFNSCIIRYNNAYGYGGGMSFIQSSPLLSNCTITTNTANGEAGLSFFNQCDCTIENCVISNNQSDGYTGGMYIGYYSNATITDTEFIGNISATGFNGGGIFIQDFSDPSLTDCIFAENQAGLNGGAVRVLDWCEPTFFGCTFESNQAVNGGAIATRNSNPAIINCTLSKNSASNYGGGIDCVESDLTLRNSIIEGTLDGAAIAFLDPDDVNIDYNDFWNNWSDNSETDFLVDIPGGLGEVIENNNNGDPCDIYSNIFLDPLFVDGENGDYHLTEDSPCIDAGDPQDPYDPDNTICDIGRFCYEPDGVDDPFIEPEIILSQNYPNPFNPVTEINFQLPEVTRIELQVFNIKGQLIKTLVSKTLPAGEYSVFWYGKDQNDHQVPSGIYFYCLRNDTSEMTRKMVLLK